MANITGCLIVSVMLPVYYILNLCSLHQSKCGILCSTDSASSRLSIRLYLLVPTTTQCQQTDIRQSSGDVCHLVEVTCNEKK